MPNEAPVQVVKFFSRTYMDASGHGDKVAVLANSYAMEYVSRRPRHRAFTRDDIRSLFDPLSGFSTLTGLYRGHLFGNFRETLFVSKSAVFLASYNGGVLKLKGDNNVEAILHIDKHRLHTALESAGASYDHNKFEKRRNTVMRFVL